MGTNRKYDGEITIDPPLNWAEIKKAQSQPYVEGYEITLVIDEQEQDTEQGTSIVKTCSTVLPWTDQYFKGYNVLEAVQNVIKACPGHRFSGYLQGVLEDGSEMWRIVAKDRAVTEIKPDISWPMP